MMSAHPGWCAPVLEAQLWDRGSTVFSFLSSVSSIEQKLLGLYKCQPLDPGEGQDTACMALPVWICAGVPGGLRFQHSPLEHGRYSCRLHACPSRGSAACSQQVLSYLSFPLLNALTSSNLVPSFSLHYPVPLSHQALLRCPFWALSGNATGLPIASSHQGQDTAA